MNKSYPDKDTQPRIAMSPASHILQSHIVVTPVADGRYGTVDLCGSLGACRAFAAQHGGEVFLNHHFLSEGVLVLMRAQVKDEPLAPPAKKSLKEKVIQRIAKRRAH